MSIMASSFEGVIAREKAAGAYHEGNEDQQVRHIIVISSNISIMHVISVQSRGQGLSARSGEESCWTHIIESGGVVRSMGRVNVGYEVPGGPD